MKLPGLTRLSDTEAGADASALLYSFAMKKTLSGNEAKNLMQHNLSYR